jgi:hypothetical protein
LQGAPATLAVIPWRPGQARGHFAVVGLPAAIDDGPAVQLRKSDSPVKLTQAEDNR